MARQVPMERLPIFGTARILPSAKSRRRINRTNKELAFQNEERKKEKRATELIIANKELAFQNEEKEKQATELIITNKELKKSGKN